MSTNPPNVAATENQAPTGLEWAIRSMIKMLGIKPEDLLAPLAEIREKVIGFDARQARLEAEIAFMKGQLANIETLLKEQNYGGKTGRIG